MYPFCHFRSLHILILVAVQDTKSRVTNGWQCIHCRLAVLFITCLPFRLIIEHACFGSHYLERCPDIALVLLLLWLICSHRHMAVNTSDSTSHFLPLYFPYVSLFAMACGTVRLWLNFALVRIMTGYTLQRFMGWHEIQEIARDVLYNRPQQDFFRISPTWHWPQSSGDLFTFTLVLSPVRVVAS